MNIGIIGCGNMGGALGTRWARAGHTVLFGSREPDKARAVAQRAAPSATSGDFDAAAAFGDVVVYTVRGILPRALLRMPGVLAGKILIDCNNTDMTKDGRPIATSPNDPTLAERLAADVPDAHVVKAFTSTPRQVIELEREVLAAARVSTLLCGNASNAKTVVKNLAEELGFVAIDCGALDASRIVDGAADFVRYQIAKMGLGPFVTLSVNVLGP
jgi:8-hydroxy-5-deazaflavin:NADPH oxidoreductase